MELISIIVPVYNGKKWIQKCLKSLIRQSYKNCEIIIINDGSTDNTESLCKKFVKLAHNIRYFYIDNSGVSAARNYGIKQAKGDFIVFVDSDDWLPKDALFDLTSAARNEEADFTVSNYYNVSLTKTISVNIFRNETLKKNSINASTFFRSMFWSPWGKLFKKSIIIENNILFPVDVKCGEDCIFVSKYISCCNKISSTEKCTYFYNQLSFTDGASQKYSFGIIKWRHQCSSEVFKALCTFTTHYSKNDYYYYLITYFFQTLKTVCLSLSGEKLCCAFKNLDDEYEKEIINEKEIELKDSKSFLEKKRFWDLFKEKKYEEVASKIKVMFKKEESNRLLKNILTVFRTFFIKYLDFK